MLKRAVAAEPRTWVLLQVPEDEAFASVQHAVEAINGGGVARVRLGPGD